MHNENRLGQVVDYIKNKDIQFVSITELIDIETIIVQVSGVRPTYTNRINS